MITICLGIGLIAGASLRIVLAAVLPTGPFLAVSPVLAFVSIGGLFAFTGYYSARARRLGEVELAAQGLAFPSVVEG